MCTLIVLHRCVPGSPVVVAANRDEFFERPAEPPCLRETASGSFVAPRDCRAGGTWLGVNAAGLFVGITNRPSPQPDPSRRSRGQVVVDALAAHSADEAACGALEMPSGAYNPFNLLLADRDRAFTVVYDEGPKLREIGPGVHVIGNADPDACDIPKVGRLFARAESAAARPPDQVLSALAAICRGHEGGPSPREDACIHAGRYGTRSSTLLRCTGGTGGEFWFADGPPCVTPYQDFSPLLLTLDHGVRQRGGDAWARMTS
ncbi:MAG TPA: NRDE family protein [Myxococcota bacterium]|nr:NRDE family protein [Myxococcota bacterium]